MSAVDSLKVFAIGGRTNSSGTTQDDIDQEELRLLAGMLLRQGITPNLLDGTPNLNAFRVRQDSGANMDVKIGSGTTKVDGLVLRGTVAGQGAYLVRIDATTITKTTPAADATNPTRYGVYAFINDAAYAGTASRAYAGLEVLAGTPAGAPTTPAPRAEWSAYALLWEFQLPALATAVTDAILDNSDALDKRVHAYLAAQNVLENQIFS
jgi:hypothetical protein